MNDIPIGTKVIAHRHDGTDFVTVTRTSVKQIADPDRREKHAVVWLKGLSMCYPVSQITVIKPEDIDKHPMSW